MVVEAQAQQAITVLLEVLEVVLYQVGLLGLAILHLLHHHKVVAEAWELHQLQILVAVLVVELLL